MSDGDEETPFGRAFAAERSGEFALAADYYVAAAARAMARGGYDSGRYSREGLGYLLRALVCDVRAGRRERARACRATYDPAVDRLVRTADERAVRGLAQEVRGDTHLVCGQGDRALSCYDRAGEAHAGLGLDSRLFWTATPEYTVVLGALQLFFEGQGWRTTLPRWTARGGWTGSGRTSRRGRPRSERRWPIARAEKRQTCFSFLPRGSARRRPETPASAGVGR